MMRANVMNTYVDGDSDSDAMRTSRTDRSIDRSIASISPRGNSNAMTRSGAYQGTHGCDAMRDDGDGRRRVTMGMTRARARDRGVGNRANDDTTASPIERRD